MSVNYAAGLSDYPNKGKCGLPEFRDTDSELTGKIEDLCSSIRESKHMVVLTGAGLSTACGIPDFRGPKGVWTLEEKGITPCFATTFDAASFSVGHLALVALEQQGFLKHLITQNVDGLHLRSGFPRDKLSILHGDMFIEECDKCRHQYIRRNSVNTMGLKHTGNACSREGKRGINCRGKLRDTILDWEDSLPNDQLDAANENARKADLFLVLGSSLQILPAGNLPLLSRKNGGKFVTVNLQKTKYHKKTDLVIHAPIDKVMSTVCEKLGVTIPCYNTPRVRLYSTNTPTEGRLPLNVTCDADVSAEDNSDMKTEIDSEKGINKVSEKSLDDTSLKRKMIVDCQDNLKQVKYELPTHDHKLTTDL